MITAITIKLLNLIPILNKPFSRYIRKSYTSKIKMDKWNSSVATTEMLLSNALGTIRRKANAILHSSKSHNYFALISLCRSCRRHCCCRIHIKFTCIMNHVSQWVELNIFFFCCFCAWQRTVVVKEIHNFLSFFLCCLVCEF